MILEVIVTTVDEALAAEAAGADRLELISGYSEGGVTPSISLVTKVCNVVTIPVNVMIRVHAKSFIYSKTDMDVMLEDIKQISHTKVNGIVFGALTNNYTIDEVALQQVIDVKNNLKLTFHRAFDEVINQEEALHTLIKYPVDILLTSGGKANAIEGIEQLNRLHTIAQNKIDIMAGAGLTPNNITQLIDHTPISQLHFGSGVRYNGNILNNIDPTSIRKIKSLM